MGPRAALAAIVAFVIAACAAGNGSPETGPEQDAGHAHDAGSDAGTPMGDALPTSAVSFFQGVDCPAGWAPFTMADGRVILPLVSTASAGKTHGKPLASGEDRAHTHLLSAAFTLSSTSYAGLSGSNNGVATAGDTTLSTATDPASSGLPYVQLLACRKSAAPVAAKAPLPHGMQVFFDMPACPAGWQQTAQTQGRFIVGLPESAPQDLTFGGPPLSDMDGGAETRSHAHHAPATLVTSSHGIALASGCCGGGYGADGTYMATQDTSDADTALPYVELLACEKQ